jgi:GT2 family glycosyltransferase
LSEVVLGSRGADERERSASSVVVVIVNYNGGSETLRCVESVLASDPGPGELVIVDNGSDDDSLVLFRRLEHPTIAIEVVPLRTNVGPAAGRNAGVRHAHGQVLAFLDNDTRVEPGWIAAALNTMRQAQAVCVQCKLLVAGEPDVLDGVGYLAGPFGFPWHIVRTGEPDAEAHSEARFLFGVKSAGMVIDRAAFEAAGAFDPAFFIYGEETDLCWRVLRSGGRIALSPESRVMHKAGITQRSVPGLAPELLYRGGPRNYIRTVAKNQHPRRLGVDIAGQVVLWAGAALIQTVRLRPRSAWLITRGVIDALGELPQLLAARRTSPLPFIRTPKELRAPFGLTYLYRVAVAL